MQPANLRVDHVSIAVRDIDRALEFFLRFFPARAGAPKQDGYDGEFRWADFTIGSFKIELVESMRSGSFIERFLKKRGPGFHHFSLKIERLDPLLERLEHGGYQIVGRHDEGEGHKTAFIHPRSAFGTLIQFWQEPEMRTRALPSWGGIVERHGVKWQVDHLSLALTQIAPAIRFFETYFGGRVEVVPHTGYDQAFSVAQLRIGDYRLELMESARAASFLERFLRRRGEGLHHISIDVEDLDEVLAPLEEAGVQVVDRLDFAPGWRTAFLHPRSAFGTLIQFWQMPVSEWWSAPG